MTAKKILIVDWMLPDMSGLELTRMLKRDKDFRDPKLIALLNSNDFGRTAEIRSPIKDGNWLNCCDVPCQFPADRVVVESSRHLDQGDSGSL